MIFYSYNKNYNYFIDKSRKKDKYHIINENYIFQN